MTLRKWFMMVALAAMVAMAPSAQAATIVQNLTFGLPVPGLTTDLYPVNVGYDLFNSNLGTLTKVTVELVTTVSPSVTVANFNTKTSASVTKLEGTTQTQATAFKGQAYELSTNTNTFYAVSTPPLPVVVVPFGSFTQTGSEDTQSASTTVTGANLAFWQVAGGLPSSTPVEISIPVNGATGQCTGGTCFFNSDPTIYGELNITYEYTTRSEVPEPMSIVLVGGSLLGLSVLMRRRAAKRS